VIGELHRRERRRQLAGRYVDFEQLPPRLVELLRAWIDRHGLADGDLLFRTRVGGRPSESNWSRALKRACANAGQPRIRVYDFRHAAATMMIKARVPLAEAARRLGHSVETLVSTYIGAMEGDDAEANALLDRALAGTRERILASQDRAPRDQCGTNVSATTRRPCDPGECGDQVPPS
jgi:integrase